MVNEAIDPAAATCYHLDMEEALKIDMPPQPEITEEDIDAQLFSFISNAPKGSKVVCLADIDDAWAKSVHPDVGGLADLRATLRSNLEQENRYAYQNLKVALTTDALIDRMRGSITEDMINAAFDGVRHQSEQAIHASGKSLHQYLREQDIDEQGFTDKIFEETKHQLALNIALDLYIESQGISVEEPEITDYLMADDPDQFMDEVHRSGKVAEAKAAAARVKAMRTLVDTVEVESPKR